LSETLQEWSGRDLEKTRRLNLMIMFAGSLVAAGALFWLFVKVLQPVNRTLRGFREVAQGNFGLQVAEQGSREIKQLTHAFNQLSIRLKVLFELIERLQQGSDLDQTLAFLSREFQTLLRIDWIGALFVTGDIHSIRLESAYLDGNKEHVGHQVFRLESTLLEQALAQETPLHVTDMPGTARNNPAYVFLRSLAQKGMRDAIFLPLGPASQSPVPGVLVFATRQAHSYDPNHLALLNNIAQLVTHSFGRTVNLARHAHLAAVGEFASGIAHEIRNPLATVSMALGHFAQLDLPANSAKRADLASLEVKRMTRLLEDMLLYAKPLRVQLDALELGAFLSRQRELYQSLATPRRQHLELNLEHAPAWTLADGDRLAQIWVNLTKNACEAAPVGASITWSLGEHPEKDLVEISVHNPGDPIAPELLPRLGQPFFTTKNSGTGLGLAIVRRLLDAHGGDMEIQSDRERGTRVVVSLPRCDASGGP
jgi:signal transduction histidine kinase